MHDHPFQVVSHSSSAYYSQNLRKQPTMGCGCIERLSYICSGERHQSFYPMPTSPDCRIIPDNRFFSKDVALLFVKTKVGYHIAPIPLPLATFSLVGGETSISLAKILSLSIRCRTPPPQGKTRVTIAVYKKDACFDPTGCRSINPAPIIVRITKRLIKDSIAAYILVKT